MHLSQRPHRYLFMPQSPNTVEELSECLAGCNSAGRAVVPASGGTHCYIGATLAGEAEPLDLSQLSGGHFYEPADMVASFGASTKLSDLQLALGAENQRLDIDPGHADSTLGGALAIDHFGPRCHGWGTLRDKILGLTYVLADGRIIKVGGRVMKNVAGYDLNKLMVGSLGTLAIMTDVTFRANPKNDAEGAWLFEFDDVNEALDAALKVQGSQLEPLAVVVFDQQAATTIVGSEMVKGAQLFVAAEGVPAFVEHHAASLSELVGTEVARSIDGTALAAIWSEWHHRLHCRDEASIVARFGARTSKCSHLKDLQISNGLVLYPGRGVGFINVDDINSLQALRQKCEFFGGYAIVHWSRDRLDAETVWGRPGADFAVMQRLKQTHDPNGILNPGRFYGGI
jgi:glycolate oxidase FAD binding subunit